jgi:probable HAF family extracellular repeat protein
MLLPELGSWLRSRWWSCSGRNASGSQHVRYKLIDIGTFGGPESFINSTGAIGSPDQINSAGTAVGGAGTPTPTALESFNPAICGGSEGFPWLGVNHAFKWQNGVLTDLGSLIGPDNCSVATSINAKGEISGRWGNGVIDPITGIQEFHAVLWKDGQISDLGTLGGSVSSGSGINALGQVAGFALNAIPDPVSIYHFQLSESVNGTQTRAFLWQNGVMQDLGTLGGPDAWSNFVNDAGQVTGFSYTDSAINPVTGVPTTHPFLWDPKRGMTDLGSLGGTLAGSEPAGFQGAINNLGQVVGASTLAGDLVFHPFLWTNPGPMQDLGTLGGDNASASGVNDAGQVIGVSDLPGNVYHAFLFNSGVMNDLRTLNGDSFSTASSINASGQIVGQSCHEPCVNHFQNRAVLWENGAIFDLNTLVRGGHSGLTLSLALVINDQGEIAGIGRPVGCLADSACGHAFVLIPCARESEDCEDPTDDTMAGDDGDFSIGPNGSAMPVDELTSAWDAHPAWRYRNPGLRTLH